MKKQGRHTDKALLRTVVNQKLQTFSHKRLMRDLEQIQNQKIPTFGVTARPLQTDLFTWHANIRGPENSPYSGGVFHLQMKFPQSYPNHPPTIKLFNNIPHPNVFGSYICLDMLQVDGKPEEGLGWTSAYSVQSVLTQLQSFLFQEHLTADKVKTENQIKKAVKDANSYKCSVCKHGGKLSLWPTFNSKEQVLEQFQIIEQQNSIIKKQLICFHTKLPYTQNQLGLGLNISKIPRSGAIKQGQTFLDYISIKAFIKQSINYTSNNQKITHWIPVYFGQGDNQQRFFHFLKKSLSMIMSNTTKNFKPQYILQVFPKLFITIAYYMMDQKKHPSIRILRILTHIHSMFLFCLEKYPELKNTIKQTVQKFITNQEDRNKDHIPNLGAILVYVATTDFFKFTDVSQAYFFEQMDRQVLWILKSVPELLSQSLEENADKVRAQTVFKTQMTSYHIFCFFKLYITTICQSRKNKQILLKQYQSNLCKLTNKQQTILQKQIVNISKKINNYSQFFKYTGLKAREENQMTKILKQAVKNSQRKAYHSRYDIIKIEEMLNLQKKKSQIKTQIIPKLPSSQDQFKKLTANIPSYQKYIKVETKASQGKKQFQFSYKEEISSQNDWKQMCISRWTWIKQAIIADPTLNSNQMSLKALQYKKKGVSKSQDRIIKLINQNYKKSHINNEQKNILLPQVDWKRLFLRLDLEDFLTYIDMNPDFSSFYQKLHVCAQNNINTLWIPMVKVNNLKSGYYYITSLLSKLTTLKYIQFSGVPQINNTLTDKAAKAIKKGLNNFYEGKGRLQILSFNYLIMNVDFSQCLFNYLSQSDSLVSLRFCKTNILAHGNSAKVLSNILVNLKQLRQLEFVKCSLDQEKCKILADSLMRMKRLQFFRLNQQKGLGQGLASIIYNLSFSPNLRVLDLNDIVIPNNTANNNDIVQTVVSLYKMLKISTSIQILKLTKVNNINQHLNIQFWKSLGETKCLKMLDLSHSGNLVSMINEVGKSIAFNAKRKGVLKYLDFTGTLSGIVSLNNLYWGMNISQYDEEQWYGDPNKVSKMIANNYKKQFYNNLNALQLDNCSNLNPNFSLCHYNKLVNKKQPEFVKILADSPFLHTLSMNSTSLQKNIADILVLALDNRRINIQCKLKVLDLSKNNLDKEGVKLLSQVLPHNNVLEVLDLSKNRMGVSGADQLAKALKTNTSLKYLNLFNNKIGYDGAKSIAQNIISVHPTLEFLELGHNRIRDKGLSSIVDAIITNKNSNLKILGLRFNFLTNTTIQNFQQITKNKTKIQQIFLRNNSFNDQGIYKLKNIILESHSKISIDLLEKVKYLDQERLDRTVWIHPISQINLGALKKFFQIQHKCGIIMDFRVRAGKKYPNKTGENKVCFVQFADSASVDEALSLAARQLTQIGGKKFRIFKAGSGTFVYLKKTAKQYKMEQAKQMLNRPNFPIPAQISQSSVSPLGIPPPGMIPPYNRPLFPATNNRPGERRQRPQRSMGRGRSRGGRK